MLFLNIFRIFRFNILQLCFIRFENVSAEINVIAITYSKNLDIVFVLNRKFWTVHSCGCLWTSVTIGHRSLFIIINHTCRSKREDTGCAQHERRVRNHVFSYCHPPRPSPNITVYAGRCVDAGLCGNRNAFHGTLRVGVDHVEQNSALRQNSKMLTHRNPSRVNATTNRKKFVLA